MLQNDTRLFTYIEENVYNGQLTFHDNHFLRVYKHDENVNKQTSIAPWQRRWRDNVYEDNENERGIIPPWQPSFKCEFIWW